MPLAIEAVTGVEAVNITVAEIDIETVGLEITVEGENIDYDALLKAINGTGAGGAQYGRDCVRIAHHRARTADTLIMQRRLMLPVALGLSDGILNTLTLAAGSLSPSDAMTTSLAIRIAIAAAVTGVFALFVAEYAQLRRELVHPRHPIECARSRSNGNVTARPYHSARGACYSMYCRWMCLHWIGRALVAALCSAPTGMLLHIM